VTHEGPGCEPDWLARAVAKAEKHGVTALLAECTSRFIRHTHFSTRHGRWRAKLQAGTRELDDLRWWTKGYRLVTVLDPNATPEEETSYQTRRQAEHKRGGGDRVTGYKKRRRNDLQPLVLSLRRRVRHNGKRKSYLAIAQATGVPQETVRRWCLDAKT
jgi:hypothetical protein